MIDISSHFTYPRLFRFVLPSILMMISVSAYSIVDGLFVSNYTGKLPFAAVNLIFPALMIFSSIGFMVGAGGSALVAKYMGEGKPDRANGIFSLLVCASGAAGLVISMAAWFLMPLLARLMGAEGELLRQSVLYGRILLLSLAPFILQRVFETFLVTAGKPGLGLGITLLSGGINILGDWLFIVQFHGGIVGAGLATVLSEYTGCLLPLIYFLCKNTSSLSLTRPLWDMGALRKTITNGASEFFNTISMSLVSMLYNYQLMRLAGENGVAAFGVIMYVSFMFEAIFIGYSMGTAPIISYNYGARRHEELKRLFKKSLLLVSLGGIIMSVTAVVLSPRLASIFVAYDPVLYDLTVRGFCLYSLSFLISGFPIYGSAFFTALNNGLISSIISILQSVVFEVAAVLILPLFLYTDGIWLSVTVAKVLALLLTLWFWAAFHKEYQYW